VFAFVILGACASGRREVATSDANEKLTFASIKATAPTGTYSEQLGLPFDREFNQIPTGTLFPDAPTPRRVPAAGFKHELVTVDTQQQLAANAKGWGVVQASSKLARESRFASYRAYQLSQVEILDDSSTMRDPPPQAIYYAWKIYYGRSYEAVVSGNARSFTASVRATFLAFDGGISGFTKEHSLSLQAAGIGLQPRSGEAIFAKTPRDIETLYQAVGDVMPVFIEYRKIPSRATPDVVIKWVTPRSIDLSFGSLHVIKDGTAGTTPWQLQVSCKQNASDILKDEPVLDEVRVSDGSDNSLTWSHLFEVVDGDRISCETSGTFHDHITTPQGLPGGRMGFTVGANFARAGTLEASSANAEYSISWDARVRGQ